MSDKLMTTIAIITARGGSKRIPNKNLKTLGGIPLLAHSIQYAQHYESIIDGLYVSTDDLEIKKIAKAFGAKVIDRPIEISGDSATSISALQHALTVLPESVQNIILLQPTNPFRQSDLLPEAFELYNTKNTDTLFTVSPNSHKLGSISENVFIPRNYKPGQRTQDLEPLFFENGLLYIAKRQLIEKGELITETSYPWVVNHVFGSVDIDTQDDFDYAEFILGKYKEELGYLNIR